MATLTDMVAAVVLHSSAAAFSHFGVTLDTPAQAEPRSTPAEQRIVARSPRPAVRAPAPTAAADRVQKASTCPEAQHASLQKA
jgi:hypothetical protein